MSESTKLRYSIVESQEKTALLNQEQNNGHLLHPLYLWQNQAEDHVEMIYKRYLVLSFMFYALAVLGGCFLMRLLQVGEPDL